MSKSKIISSFCISMVLLVGIACQHTQAQETSKTIESRYAVTAEQAKAAKQDFTEVNRLVSRVRQNGSLTDEEIRRVGDLLSKENKPPVVKMNCLKPFTFLKATSLKPGQEEKIVNIIKPILTAEDSASDPEGNVKMYALVVVKNALRAKFLLPLIQRLKGDGRENVRSAAELAEKRLSQ